MPDLNPLSNPLRQIRQDFEALIEPHRAPLWRYCLRLTGSIWDAEDLLQETLTKAFARLVGFWQPIDPRPYLFRIVSNTWIDALRRTQPQLMEELPEATDHADPGEALGAMESLIHLLPPRQRIILLLIDVFDFTAPEVAAMLSQTEGAVRAALHRARTTLRRQGEAKEVTPMKRAEASAVITRLMDAFTRRDMAAFAALVDEEATAEIVGVAEEYGRETIMKYSMADTFGDATPYEVELHTVSGREVLCFFYRTSEHPRALGWVIEVTVTGERLTKMKGYWFTPEFLLAAAAELGVPALTHGYTV